MDDGFIDINVDSYHEGYNDALNWVLDNCDMTEESFDQVREALEEEGGGYDSYSD